MSRLIVKNLPKSITENRLKEIFDSQGSVTECKLKFTKDGVFRRFAFVGFQTESEAELAKTKLDKTFVDAFRIQVEICKPFGDDSKPRAWSKYAKDSSAYKRLNVDKSSKLNDASTDQPESGPEKKRKKRENTEKDSKFTEFLELHEQKPSTSDCDSDKSNDKEENSEKVLEEQLLAQKPAGEKHLLIIFGLPLKVKLKNLKEFVAPVRLKTVRLAKGDNNSGALVSFQRSADLRRLLKRNGEFFGGFKLKMKRVPNKLSASEKSQKKEELLDLEENKIFQNQELEIISDTGRLFLRNLSYLCSVEDLEKLFADFGPLADVTLPMDKRLQKPKGYAVVTFMIPEHAIKAYSQLDGTIFQGRMLHILAGKEKPGDEQKASDSKNSQKDSTSAYKKQKIAALKAAAGKSHTWNSLFLGPAAVADVLAEKLDAEKSEILNPEAQASLGVRMALGETRLVKETRDFLVSHGVALDAFGRVEGSRSKTVILVKNLPANTEVDKVRQKFEKFGNLGRVLLPPAGVTALVEFVDGAEAKKAFEALAYSRFGSVPLFLEWAPGEVFSGKVSVDDPEDEEVPEKTEEGQEKEMKQDLKDSKEELELEEAEDKKPEPATELFVKNLNFETTDESLRNKFERIGEIFYATVAKKTASKEQKGSAGNGLASMGFGFVQYFKAKDAQRALKELQGELLEGHSLELKLSEREKHEGDPKRKSVEYLEQGESTKILVRNIAFQASEKELKELFSAFGEIRSIRLPKKVGAANQHRGFAFVDFTTRATARRVFKALCHSTHLYGRRLVLEWAKEDESLDDVRKRTAEHFASGEKRVKRAKEKRKFMSSLSRGN